MNSTRYTVHVKYFGQGWIEVETDLDREQAESLRQELEDDGNAQILLIPCSARVYKDFEFAESLA